MDTLVLASGNQKKLDEMRAILEPLALKVVPQSDFQVPEAEETGLTFVENAILKARNAAAHTGLPAIADDSGLEVDALNGAPGIYSARFSGADASDAKNNALLIDMLGDLPDAPRTARYQAVLVLMRHPDDPTPLICQGTWEGEILLAPRGNGGFGYDPHFLIPELGVTAAEMEPAEKNRISHRGRALKALMDALREPSE
ncbi:RdgB/HAM1 family non-canonical purine NTP pyrophosphatase [Alloalcanivorax venustensis]|jgi:XTP/dITP diphosphohydrolase|uniref:RdgB/HAM1 family non-canonical purine NTP pyrophosphatase n=1 Tax=Alloalcanivorax TaxID=3020832 RepID=UPI000C941295|nr:non-canonical purine NTP pyrophosphatase, RdgB/HAM1 family [Alcanivorax sp.]MEC8879830.1 RdgB/HAM1 family non-canonical purine NTP pyrophosphatase [Pseudomonadota bacterium]MTI50796.1 RdgB/HAM1 family non-canonical purine NTP pyrophosphatase [Alcanivorax sp.]HAD44955.1 non-canonical purine NTP pyrophosphatase, RdgB/HAM1 family [Alcanivorax sp.]HAI34457.1 non-canonical purine NTP pyrophosphatase, RdgB/HAM1 family [Alcanivorax sp.]|tara:strand:+ start:28008 stop:28607 length:600 start_codon:yes stop_codon:yes gene_type:complete